MHIVVVGLSHKTAPVELREKLSFDEDSLEDALHHLTAYKHLNEGVILSTCNRTEVYAVCDDIKMGTEDVRQFLVDFCGLKVSKLSKHLYYHDSVEAAHHLYRVVSSLDSMVVGEAQVLGQVKNSYSHAFEAGVTNVVFNRLFRDALKVGKKVRTETDIGESAVSISYAAVELAKKVFEDLEGRTVMVLGAGEMSELTAMHLVESGAKSVLVSNRTYERAVELAERFGGKAVTFNAMLNHMVDADIVISSTGAPHFILSRKDVSQVMHKRRGKPIFFIDIAVPRDIDPKVNKIDNAYLYDIDDLQAVVDANKAERNREGQRAELIIDREVEDFVAWLNSLEVVPAIAELKKKAEAIRAAETLKSLNKLEDLSDKDKNIINALTTVIVNKLLHEPIVQAKKCAGKREGYLYIESLRYLFGLEETTQSKVQKLKKPMVPNKDSEEREQRAK